MKKSNIKKIDRKALLSRLASETNECLARKGARTSLIAAYVFFIGMAGTGLIVSYLFLNLLDYWGVRFSDQVAMLVMFVFVYLFGAPAFSGVRHTARAVCDGREATLPEIFAVFGDLKAFGKSYLPLVCLSWIPKYERSKVWKSRFAMSFKARMAYARIVPHILDFLLSFATCFVYYIIVAGPRAVVRRELMLRKIKYINSKNNERTVTSND